MGDDLILKAITHAAVAGGCRIWARRDERVARGMNQCADDQSGLAATCLDQWLKGCDQGDFDAVLVAPSTAERGLRAPGRKN